jgi:uncharacterized protein YdhG (YjbR/CyaY superfamily)
MVRASAKSEVAVEETGVFSAAEKEAMRERAREVKKAPRRGKRDKKAEDAESVVAKLAEMSEADRVLGQRIHEIVTAAAPSLAPKLWYGMPSYAKDGKVLCFYQPAEKFGTRYATLGFNDIAQLDDGAMWPASYAITEMNAENEARLAELVKKAVGDGPIS